MTRIPLMFVVLLLTLFPMTATATTVVKLDFDQLTKASDAIVVGHVESVTADLRGGRVYSTIVISVDEVLKGEAEKSLKIVQIGGRTKELVTRAHGMPSFVAGEHVLLFLEQPKSVDHYVVTGLAQGKKRLAEQDDGSLTLRAAETPVHTVQPRLTAVPTKIGVTPKAAPSTLAQARTRIAELQTR